MSRSRSVCVALAAMLLAAMAAACTSDESESEPEAGGGSATAVLEFRPVLGVDSPDDLSQYELGPDALSGVERPVADAQALQDQLEQWNVYVELSTEASDAFNDLAVRCFAREATCPTAQIAIVVDGEVLSAPAVQTDRFDSTISIGGDFDADEAEELARRLGA